MRGLIQLFAAYGNFILFLLLEGLALLLVVQFNHRQHEILNHSWILATAAVEHRIDRIGDYIGLREEVFKLQGENQRLKQQLESAQFSNAINQDTARNKDMEPLYTYIPANVVSNSVTNNSNYLRLNRGRRHSVAPPMGVISEDGIVGVVRAVSEHYSSVMSLLHRETRIKASIGNQGYFGTLTWGGSRPQYMQLGAVPKHAKVEAGDTVYTSGYSQLFPPGIIIGVAEEVTITPGTNFYTIDVKLNNDLSKLRYVYVINNRMKEEHEKLDEQTNE
jgi:rod shape-determining protein MreC